jgi:hypothetical protein
LFGRANEAFDARDMDALLAEHHPHVEIVVLRSEIEGPYRGHEGLRRMSADNFEANVEVRIDEIRDCGDRVLVLGHQHATLRGARWDHVLAEFYELEDGKITRMQAFPTIEDASKPPGCGSSRCRRRAHDGWSITHDA